MGAPRIDKVQLPYQAIEAGQRDLKANPTWSKHARALSATVLSSLLDQGWTLVAPKKEDGE